MAARSLAIINAYLTAVNGAALDHSKQAMVGYVTDPDFLHRRGWAATPSIGISLTPNDAVHAAALDVLQHLEVIGGDLLLKRGHQNSSSISACRRPTLPKSATRGQPSSQSGLGAEQLVTMSGDLGVAQDYENYLNNREAINALMAANPESAFTAGWIATFARVSELGLNHVNASDFTGGLVGWLDSVKKAGLGGDASNVSYNQIGSTAIIEIKVANGSDVPGALSAFADQTNQTSDATGTTVQFVFNSGLVPLGFHGPSFGHPVGDSRRRHSVVRQQ